MAHEHDSHNDRRTQSAAKWVFIGFLMVAGYFLMMEHRAHLSGISLTDTTHRAPRLSSARIKQLEGVLPCSFYSTLWKEASRCKLNF
jgi:hypothetical protein